MHVVPMKQCMMKTILISTAIVLASALPVYAQEAPPPARSIFKLSPQHFFDNSLKVGVERFNQEYSGSFAIFLTGMIDNDQYSGYGFDEGYDGIALEFQLRKYISAMKPTVSKHGRSFHQGVYGAAYAQGGYYEGASQGETYQYDPMTGNTTPVYYNYVHRITNGGFGFTIGYQKTLWEVVFLEAFIGGGIQFSGSEVSGIKVDDYFSDEGIIDPAYRGILPKIGLNIGIGL